MPRLRSHRLTAIAAASALAGISVFTAAGAANASGTINYVALGDSYSSGDGAGNYSDGSCLESSNAYPVLWYDSHGGTFTNETCAGATTTDVLNSQLGPLSASTTLVTITIGGNDVGFANVMTTCVLGATSQCVSAVQTAENEAITTLPGELDNTLSAIKSRAPNAKVVVLDYPQFYDLSLSSVCIGLSTTDRTYLNQGAAVLDTQIQDAAARANDTFVDVVPYFAGHQICDWNSYIISVDWLNLSDSYHPNASGQKYAYLPALDSVTG
ncbi:MAG TPA: SGNH/GDSL hydrolase family protein [Streptosporangiaceae bacterium]|nr:SGNH/GDSL hydrolase family protein [Streptosporangiaceae bacterium]